MSATLTAYAAANGAKVRGGRSLPLPAWMTLAGVALNKVVAVPGTSNLASAAPQWGGYPIDLALNRVWLCGNGGHTDASDNSVVELRLNDDSPAWRQICGPTASPVADIPWQADGKGTSIHSYDYVHWVPSVGRIIRNGIRAMASSGGDGAVAQGFNPDASTPAWDAANTYPYTPGDGYGAAVDHVHGVLFSIGSGKMFDPQAKTRTASIALPIPMRYPLAYSTVGDFFLCVQWGGGEEAYASLSLSASLVPRGGGAQQPVNFNASAAFTQFTNEGESVYNPGTGTGNCGMCYDSLNDCFYWASFHPGRENHIFKFKRAGNGAFDVSLLPLTGAVMPACPSSGLNGRIKHFPLLKGLVINPTGTQMYFVQTSA